MRYLLRSEAVPSSYIEGLRANARNIIFEELKRLERTRIDATNSGSTSAAAEVAGNTASLTSAVERLGAAESVTWPDIEALQGELLPDLSQPGRRDRQGWVEARY